MKKTEYALQNVLPDGLKLFPQWQWLLEPFGVTASYDEAQRVAQTINDSRRETQNFGDLPPETYVAIVRRDVVYKRWAQIMQSNGLVRI